MWMLKVLNWIVMYMKMYTFIQVAHPYLQQHEGEPITEYSFIIFSVFFLKQTAWHEKNKQLKTKMKD